jgi:pimeloyl-ACP methyl ester carboxylesterase
VPGAELVRLEGLGHCPQSDDPAGVARTILEVTARAEVPATARCSG